jgi:hypothetical protein
MGQWKKQYILLVCSGCVLITLLFLRVWIGTPERNIYSQAHTIAELRNTLERVFPLGEAQASDVVKKLEQDKLDCGPYASKKIVCWIPAPNTETPYKGVVNKFLGVLLSAQRFNIVFVFKNNTLVRLELSLDTIAP